MLEHITIASVVIFCAGLTGVLVVVFFVPACIGARDDMRGNSRLMIYSVLAMAGSSLLALVGFSIFWRSAAGIAAVFIVLATLVVQVLTAICVVLPRCHCRGQGGETISCERLETGDRHFK